MSSEIRTNLISSRAGLSTVTLTDSGPMFSGITTFVDNSTFSVGTGGTIHAPATNTLNIGVNNTESIRIDSNSNLKVAGIVTATHFYGDGSNLTGVSAGFSPDAQGNLVAGTSAGANFSGTDANHNILIGYEAGNALTTADNNVAIGFEALKSADTEGGNVAIGYRAMKEMTGFGGNVCIGYEAGYYTYGLWDCVAIGKDAMQKPTQSGYTAWSVAVGVEAMAACGASKCVAIGYEALHGNNASSAEDNTAIGYQSLTSVLGNGLKNTAVGSLSGKATTSGDENVYIGYNAGNNAHTTGSNCIIIGNDAAATSSSVSNEITLGDANITKFRIPGLDYVNDAGNVGIGTDNPQAQLEVYKVGTGVTATSVVRGEKAVFAIMGDATNTGASETDARLVFSSDGDVSPSKILTSPLVNHGFEIALINEEPGSGLRFHDGTANTERLRIDSGGRVLIGGTSSAGDGNLIVYSSDRLHAAIRGAGTSSNHANGYNLLSDNYTATESQLNLGVSYSGSGVVFSRNVKVSGSADNTYLSSNAQYSTRPSAFKLDDDGSFVFLNTSTNATTAIDSAVTLSERLRITNDGKIGINVTDPDSDVEINRGSEGKYLTMGGDDANNGRGLSFTSSEGGTGSNGALHTINAKSGNGEIAFAASGSERVRIKNAGDLQVRRDGNGDVFRYYRAGASLFVIDNLSTDNNTRMRIRNPGGSISYNSGSDYRLKENDVKITDGITRLKKLRPITFNWKSGTNTYDGFFAHEVSEACPQAVDGTKDQVATADDVSKGEAKNIGDPIYQGLDHSTMVPLLTAALQEAITKIETLEQENITLRVRVTNLEDK